MIDQSQLLVKSAARVLDVLELLGAYPGGLTIKDISHNLKIPQSSTSSLVHTLLIKGFLQESITKKYKLGPKIIQIGTSVIESLDFHSQAQPFLQQLMEEVNETVFMAVFSEGEIVYVSKIDSNRSVRTNVQVGSKKPLYCTALGKVFLAHLHEEECQKILSGTKMQIFTKNTITNLQDLRLQLDAVRVKGYSIDNEEIEEGLGCLASPIFDRSGQVIAAISVAGPNERVTLQHENIENHLLNTAARISENLGYYGKFPGIINDGKEVETE